MNRSGRYAVFGTLWLVWCLLLPGLFSMAIITGDGHWYHRYGWVSSVVLVIAAWLNWLLCRHDRLRRFSALMAMGMTWGMLADFYGNCLSSYFAFHSICIAVPLFALGHVCYVYGTLDAARHLQLTRRPRWLGTLSRIVICFCLLGVALWGMLVYPSATLRNMSLPTLAYSIFLAAAAAVMVTVAVFDRRFIAMGLGGVLFMASDAFLAVGLFQDNWHGLGDYCWITYGTGQMLIVYGAIAATWQEGRAAWR